MLYREIMAVCSEIHTKHINILCGQNIQLLNVKQVVYIVTTRLYSVKAHTTFDCCSTGHTVSSSTLYCVYLYVRAVCVVLCSAGRHIAMFQLQPVDYC